MSRVASSHHVLGVEHLLCELGHGEGAVLLAAAGGERGEARHEEVQPGQSHIVLDDQLYLLIITYFNIETAKKYSIVKY